VVAKRKTRKDEHELPPAALENPYALLSREELDAAWDEVQARLAALPDAPPERDGLSKRREQISDGYLWRMVRLGLLTWSGGKPKGSKNPVKVSPGPYISDYVIEDRR